MSKTDTHKQEEYRRLGAQIEAMYDTVNPDRHALYRTALLKGIMGGVGGVLGATIVIALLIWLLSLFDSIPLVGPFLESVRHTLQTRH